jgi:predicted alpha/beta superfamily hydrolase
MRKDNFFLIAIFIVLLGSFASAMAQNMTVIHDTIYSDILKEKRIIDIMLPGNQKADANERFDVLYVTDGEWNTKVVLPIYQFLADKWLIPKNIIISIPHNNLEGVNLRDRDLVPPHDNSPISGRADNFLSFFKNELIPYITKTYPTSGKNTISGHSLGGTFIMYALLTEPQLFDSYIVGDPAFWSDNYYINKFAADKLHNFSVTKTLFMTGHGTKDGSDFRSMGIFSMDSILTTKAPSGLQWKSVAYLDETHRSILLKTIYDGLRFTYYGYGQNISFNPMNGVLLKNKPVKISPPDEYYHLNLRYTTDGSEPTETSPKYEGIDLTGAVTLKLKLFSPSGRYDQTVTGNFKIGDVFPAMAKPKNLQSGGLRYAYYKGEWNSLPDFKKLKPDQSGVIGEVYNRYGEFNFPNQTKLACRIEGYLEIKEDGYYSFLVATDDAAKLYLSDRLIIKYDGIEKNMGFQTYILPLERGFYPVRLEYLQKKEGGSLRFSYKLPGAWQILPVQLELLYNSPVIKTR